MDRMTLLEEARRVGLTVFASGGRLVVRGPRRYGAIAQRLIDRKADVLAVLAMDARACRCGSTETIDVSIHGGRSIRRDCARCQRFISFPKWYGNT